MLIRLRNNVNAVGARRVYTYDVELHGDSSVHSRENLRDRFRSNRTVLCGLVKGTSDHFVCVVCNE